MSFRLLLFAALLALFPGAPASADEPAAPSATAVPFDWGVAYYMSYDNNLERCGKPIIDMIRAGVVSDRTVAAVEADFTDPGGMHRFVITPRGVAESRLSSDDSANEDSVIEYLEWFVRTFRCRRYVFTFLDHGGTLDAMCFDENPGASRPQWMSGRRLGEKLRAFRARSKVRVELLFLQQCGRGSIENLYSFRGTSEFIMSSPVPVGAPNTYYGALHRWLGETPDASGAEVAAKIASEDRDYTIYTCLRAEKLAEMPGRVDAAIAPILARKALTRPELPAVIHPVGEPIVDAAAYLRRLAAANRAGEKEVAAFLAWVEKDLFTAPPFVPEGRHARSATALCGLSIFVPRNGREAGLYGDLDMLKESRLGELWRRLLVSADRKPKAF